MHPPRAPRCTERGYPAKLYAEERELNKRRYPGRPRYSRRHYAEVFGKGGHGVPIPKNVRHSGL